jgi:hypothetical protein
VNDDFVSFRFANVYVLALFDVRLFLWHNKE